MKRLSTGKEADESMVCFDWLIMVTAGMLSHTSMTCITGLCTLKQGATAVVPSIPSALFCFAMCCLIADYNWWPCSLKRPHKIFIILYEIALTCCLVDFSMALVFVPLQNFNVWLLDGIGDKCREWNADNIGCYLKSNEMLYMISVCVSIFFNYFILSITERLEEFKKLVNQSNLNEHHRRR